MCCLVSFTAASRVSNRPVWYRVLLVGCILCLGGVAVESTEEGGAGTASGLGHWVPDEGLIEQLIADPLVWQRAEDRSWYFSGGAVARQLRGRIRSAAPPLGSLVDEINRRPVLRGDVGLFRGRDIDYDDGSVYLDWRGLAQESYWSGELESNQAVFYSSSYGSVVSDTVPLVANDLESHTLGFYLRAGQKNWSGEYGSLGWSMTFSAQQAHLQTGEMNSGTATLWKNLHRFEYDKAMDEDGDTYLVTRPQEAAESGRRLPRQFTTAVPYRHWQGWGETEVQFRRYEWFLSADVSLRPLPYWEVGLAIGPTLSVTDVGLRSRTGWQGDNGRPIREVASFSRSNESHLQVGAGADLRTRVQLDREGKVWVEAHGGYRWQDSLRVSGGLAEAEMDASGWEAGVGFGLQMGGWPQAPSWVIGAGISQRRLNAKLGVEPPSRRLIPQTAESFRYRYPDPGMPRANRRGMNEDYGGFEDGIYRLAFEELIPQHELNGSSLAREVDAWAHGGYFRLGQQWVQVKESTLGWSLTTTWLQAQFAAGRQQPIRDRESERRGEYAFQSIPWSGDDELYGIVIDPQLAQAAGGGGPYRAPSRTESTRVLHDWKGFTDATMQVRLTEWFLSLDKSWYPLPGLQVGLSAGPTVNWLQTDLLSVSGWEGADGRQLADAAERQRRQFTRSEKLLILAKRARS